MKLEVLKRKKIEKPKEQSQKQLDEKEMSEEEKAKQRAKPVSSTPVSGTPWCVVWTRDGRVFFYNPTERISLWERPLMLLNRADVDKLVSEVPKGVDLSIKPPANDIKKSASNLSQQIQPQTVVKKKLETQVVSETVTDEPPSKKNRVTTTTTSDVESPVSIQDADAENSNDSKADKDKEAKKVESNKETAMEAELKAARERAQVPLEQRIKQFKEMLLERDVSAFSTWEKELHKIVFDPRYLLLTSKERKQVFEKFIKERADDERKEKAVLIKKKKENFRELLKEANVNYKMTFNEFTTRHCKDERFRQIEKMKERESLFNDYQADLRNKEKEDKYLEKEKYKKDFLNLLKELKHLNYNSSWSETRKTIENDPRYRAVVSNTKREDYFRDYIRGLPDLNNSSLNDGSKNPDAEAENEEAREKRKAEKEKQERVEASIKEREKEVKEQLFKFHSEREKERDQLKRDEAIECFKALLSDLIKNLDLNWKDAKKILKKDARYDFCKLLSKDDKEGLYNDHLKVLKNKKKTQFYALLDDTTGINLNSTWKEAKKLIKNDPRYEKLTQLNDIKLDKEFDSYISDKFQKAKNDFKQLLQETKLITYKSYSMIEESEQHLKDIQEFLSKDKCYVVLEYAPEERKKMILDYVQKLDREGPPPPPTATEPGLRRK